MHGNVFKLIVFFSADGTIKVYIPEASVTTEEEPSCSEPGLDFEADTDQSEFNSNISNTSITSVTSTSATKDNEQKENQIPNDDGKTK